MEADRILHGIADLAEQEIAANTATNLAKAGTRCRGPNVTWQSILKESLTRTPSKAAAAKWVSLNRVRYSPLRSSYDRETKKNRTYTVPNALA